MALLNAAKIPLGALRDPELLISGRAVAWLLEESARRSGRSDFGLRLAETRRLGNLGDVALVLREEPTLHAAIGSMIRYSSLHNDSVRLSLEDAGDLALIHVRPRDGAWRDARQGLEMSVAILLRTLRLLTRGAFRPEAVCFMHERPLDLRAHVQVLGPSLRFGQEVDAIVCRAADLAMPIPSADPEIGRHVKRRAGSRLAGLGEGVEEDVRELIGLLLPIGACSVGRIARHLGCDRRTLVRRLQSVGGPNRIIGQVRADLAITYLSSGQRSLIEVSEMLGFSAASAFSRWFRRSSGESPSAWRRRHVGGNEPSH